MEKWRFTCFTASSGFHRAFVRKRGKLVWRIRAALGRGSCLHARVHRSNYIGWRWSNGRTLSNGPETREGTNELPCQSNLSIGSETSPLIRLCALSVHLSVHPSVRPSAETTSRDWDASRYRRALLSTRSRYRPTLHNKREPPPPLCHRGWNYTRTVPTDDLRLTLTNMSNTRYR